MSKLFVITPDDKECLSFDNVEKLLEELLDGTSEDIVVTESGRVLYVPESVDFRLVSE